MGLNQRTLKGLEPAERDYRVADEKGLYIIVKTTGSIWWRWDYKYNGKRQTAAFGVWPEVSLAEARDRRDEGRKLLRDGKDPRRKRTIDHNFGDVSAEWVERFGRDWSDPHRKRTMRYLDKDFRPFLKDKPVGEISARDVLDCLDRMVRRGTIDSAHRARITIGQVLRYAVATGRASRDVTQDLKGALPPLKVVHRAAIIEPEHFGELMRMIHGYHGTHIVCCALRLAPLVFLRPGELRHLTWDDYNTDKAQVLIRGDKMKKGRDHIVPLSTQAVQAIEDAAVMSRHRSNFIFPGMRTVSRPISENTINVALRSLGIDRDMMCGHGFRASARTMLEEVLGYEPRIIEHQLAHQVRDADGRAYNRTAHIDARREMMQKWADYLDTLRLTRES